MHCLRLAEGRVTCDMSEMREGAVDYSERLYATEECDGARAEELLEGLSQLSPTERTGLTCHLSGVESGCGTDGLWTFPRCAWSAS